MTRFPFHQLLNWAAYAVSLRGSRSLSGHDPGIKTLAQGYRFLMPDDLTMIPDSSGRRGHGAIGYFLVYYEISLGSLEIAECKDNFLKRFGTNSLRSFLKGMAAICTTPYCERIKLR